MNDFPDQPAPRSQVELEAWMKKNCFNFNGYSINRNIIHEGFGIERSDKQFTWYYTERGQKKELQYFATEAEIVAHAFEQISADKWAATHCLGFTVDAAKSDKLKNILQTMSIKYFEDKIPFYGPQRPVYRIFVYGCDIKKTEHLSHEYCAEGTM